MSKAKNHLREHIEYHKEGSVRAGGEMRDGVPCGYWEWLRKDGKRMQSGHLKNGEQMDQQMTY